ncbi:MAG: nitroreductase family protein [Anaerolineae bacterium]|nr:nitroreductase family protein [Anaerolineae bacterium]
MDFYETIRRRRSVRRYSDQPVPEEAITRCLEAARLAPSWRNGQPWRFIVVRDRNTIRRLTRANWGAGAINLWLKDAPVLVVACADPRPSGLKGDQPYYLVDVAIALEHLVLAATAEGLGTCWIGGFSEEKVREILGIPPHIRVVAMTPLGYPADEKGLYDRLAVVGKRQTRRLSLQEIVRYEKW